jgi:hypothetical protein
VPLSDPLRAGEPGPIYAYASPVGRPHRHGLPASPAALVADVAASASATVAATADNVAQAPITNRRLALALELEGPRLVSTIQALSAFQHMPFHSTLLHVDWTGLDRLGQVKVRVDAPLTMSYVALAWQRFLRRFHDPGSAYVVSFHAHPGAPVAFSVPSISGRAQQGQTLTGSHGDWANSPTAYRYQWDQCDRSGKSCAPISGATAQSYELTAADVGHTIRVQEAAGNAVGSGNPSTSKATTPVAKLSPPRTSSKSVSGKRAGRGRRAHRQPRPKQASSKPARSVSH